MPQNNYNRNAPLFSQRSNPYGIRGAGGGRYSNQAFADLLLNRISGLDRPILNGSDYERLATKSAGSLSDYLGMAAARGGSFTQGQALYEAGKQRAQAGAYDAFASAKLGDFTARTNAQLGFASTFAQDDANRNQLNFQHIQRKKDRRAAFWNSVIGTVGGVAATAAGGGMGGGAAAGAANLPAYQASMASYQGMINTGQIGAGGAIQNPGITPFDIYNQNG